MPRVEGAAELDRILKAMPKDMAVRQMNQVLRAGAAPVVTAMKNFAPSGSRLGNRRRYSTKGGKDVQTLKDSIGMQSKKNFEFGITMVKVGPDRRNFYAPMVEYGHAIVGRGQRKERRTERALGGTSSFGRVPAYPFARPAWAATKDIALARASAKTQQIVKKWGRKNTR